MLKVNRISINMWGGDGEKVKLKIEFDFDFFVLNAPFQWYDSNKNKQSIKLLWNISFVAIRRKNQNILDLNKWNSLKNAVARSVSQNETNGEMLFK